jgi:hypothetical protein
MSDIQVGLGSYALCRPSQMIVQVISSPYKVEDEIVTDVRLVFDPMTTFTTNVKDLEVIQELQ